MAAYRMPVADRIASCLPTELRTAAKPGAIDLSADRVSGRASASAVLAARDALDAGETHYTDRPGIAPLRARLAESIRSRHGLELRPDNVVVSSGALEGTFAAIWVGLFGIDRGTLVTADPANAALPRLACLAGARNRLAATSAADGFRLRADAVGRALDGGAQLLVIGSPDPTSGAAITSSDLAAIGELAERHDLTVVLDESLARLAPESAPAATLRDAPRLADRTVVIGSFSHDAGLAAWRVGYFAASTEAFARMRSLKQALSICSPSVSQYAALGSLDELDARAGRHRKDLEQRRAAFVAPLEQAGLTVLLPEVPLFAWVNVGSIGLDDSKASDRLAAAGIQARAGSSLGTAAAGWFRFTMALPVPELAACGRVVAESLRGSKQ